MLQKCRSIKLKSQTTNHICLYILVNKPNRTYSCVQCIENFKKERRLERLQETNGIIIEDVTEYMSITKYCDERRQTPD